MSIDKDKEVDLGPQKDEHINQYGKQENTDSRELFDGKDSSSVNSDTISNKKNSVQENAHKDAQSKSNN